MMSVAILGCGFMGTALLESWLQQSASSTTKTDGPEFTFSACVRTPGSLERLKKDIQMCSRKADDLAFGPEAAVSMTNKANIVILGCAPSDLNTMLRTPGLAEALGGKTIISLLAGMSYQQLEEAMISCRGPSGQTFARVLPSLGAKIGESVSLIAKSAMLESRKDKLQIVESLFKQVGTLEHVPELLMDEATALGAVCHALTLVAVDTMADASAANGLPRPTALKIAAQCLRSAGGLMQSGMSPEEIKGAMAVPTGITINSVLNLERGARPEIADAVRKAIAHTRNMS